MAVKLTAAVVRRAEHPADSLFFGEESIGTRKRLV
jgi:hypothetical protein